MQNKMSSSAASSQATIGTGSKLKDPCWNYAIRLGTITQQLHCKYYNQFMSGRVNHLKHLASLQGNYASCLKVPYNVKVKVLELLNEADAKSKLRWLVFKL